MYPLKFQPILKTVVWGGEKIAPFKHIDTDQHNIGESWELSGVKGNESVVADGPWAGRTVAELVREYKGELVGRHVYANTGDEFPLLIKFIDARDDLSIQVHPDDALAAVRHDGSKGKTEMWYIVGAEPGAHLLAGMTEEIAPEDYERKVADGTITDVLARHDVAPGDVFFLPAGRVHAICGGCFIAEIQQTSDITYRIFDYNRPGLDGKPRQLHTELAKDAIDYRVFPDYRTAYESRKNEETTVVDCAYFTTAVYDLDRPFRKDLSGTDSFLVVICTAGSGTLTDSEADGTHTVDIRQGDTVLIPAASAGVTFTPSAGGSLKLVTSCIR